MHSGYRVAFDGPGLQILSNEFAGNVLIFGDDNSLMLIMVTIVLGEKPADDINDGLVDNMFNVKFSKAKA